MRERRARNVISRVPELGIRCADLLDQGMGDQQVADGLNGECRELLKKVYGGRLITARTVLSFRKADYEAIREERDARVEARNQTLLVLEAGRGAGGVFAEAAQDLLAKMLFDLLKAQRDASTPLDGKALAAMGKTITKIVELGNDRIRIEMLREKEEQARRIKEAVAEKGVSGEALVAKVDEIMGIRK